MQLWTRPLDHPTRTLIASFAAWKALLLVIAACSPGPGYDTSTSLAFPHGIGNVGELSLILRYMASKLTRWDAIYFVKAANRGYLFEQEWAFGWGFTRLIALCSAVLEILGINHYEGLESLVGIFIAHFSHLLSVLALFSLTRTVFPGSHTRFAYVTAILHILSPAGLFLSAPYAESSFSFLSFSGCLLLAKGSVDVGRTSAGTDLLVLLSGIVFGIATTFRSNGLLNGLLFLQEALQALLLFRHGFQISIVRRLAATGLGGMSIAVGFLLPQYIAYREYCEASTTHILRPWCERTPPSIYTFVQDHYWNVGFLRYWTISNLPLFLLASPMIMAMIASGAWALNVAPTQNTGLLEDYTNSPAIQGSQKDNKEAPTNSPLLRSMAISQLMLTMLTLTSAHVQIITRISSGYPVWLWYLAWHTASFRGGKSLVVVDHLVSFMVIYAIVQGGLFASFLPPA